MSRGGRRRGNPHPCTGNSSRATDRRLIQWQPHITDREVAKGQSGGTRAANLEGIQQGATEKCRGIASAKEIGPQGQYLLIRTSRGAALARCSALALSLYLIALFASIWEERRESSLFSIRLGVSRAPVHARTRLRIRVREGMPSESTPKNQPTGGNHGKEPDVQGRMRQMRGKQAAGAVRECHRARSAILPILDDLEARPGTAGELLWPMLRPGRHLPVAANGNDPVKPPGGGLAGRGPMRDRPAFSIAWDKFAGRRPGWAARQTKRSSRWNRRC